MLNDPIVEELHQRGREIAAKFNHDIHVLCRYYREREQLENRRFVTRAPRLIKDLPQIGRRG